MASGTAALEEGALRRALRDVRRVSDTWSFRIIAALITAGFAAAGVLIPSTEKPVLRVTLAALAVLGGAMVAGGLAFMTMLVATPFRQRNEARHALRATAKDDSTHSAPDLQWFPSYHAALADLDSAVRCRLAERGTARIRWVCVTMESAWPVVQALLLHVLEAPHQRLKAELAVVDPRAVGDAQLRGRVEASLRNVRRFLKQHGRQLADRRCELVLYQYVHRPTWHGALVDDDLLFFSGSNPQDLQLAAPQSGAEKILGSTDWGRARIHHVRSWFDVIADSPPLTSLGATSQAALSRRRDPVSEG